MKRDMDMVHFIRDHSYEFALMYFGNRGLLLDEFASEYGKNKKDISDNIDSVFHFWPDLRILPHGAATMSAIIQARLSEDMCRYAASQNEYAKSQNKFTKVIVALTCVLAFSAVVPILWEVYQWILMR